MTVNPVEFAKLKGHVLNNPIRLGIMIYLLSKGIASFTSIQKALELTPGNLDTHLKTLEKAGYIELKKVISDRPRTAVFLTPKGAEETEKYLKILKKLLDSV